MGFLIVEMLILFEFGIKLVWIPLLRSSLSSDGRLMVVKLWTFLVLKSGFNSTRSFKGVNIRSAQYS